MKLRRRERKRVSLFLSCCVRPLLFPGGEREARARLKRETPRIDAPRIDAP